RGQTFFGVVGARRESKIKKRDRRTLRGECRHCTALILRRDDIVVGGEGPLHLGTNVLVIIANEKSRFGHGGLGLTGKLTTQVVPLPGSLETCMLPPWA